MGPNSESEILWHLPPRQLLLSVVTAAWLSLCRKQTEGNSFVCLLIKTFSGTSYAETGIWSLLLIVASSLDTDSLVFFPCNPGNRPWCCMGAPYSKTAFIVVQEKRVRNTAGQKWVLCTSHRKKACFSTGLPLLKYVTSQIKKLLFMREKNPILQFLHFLEKKLPPGWLLNTLEGPPAKWT